MNSLMEQEVSPLSFSKAQLIFMYYLQQIVQSRVLQLMIVVL